MNLLKEKSMKAEATVHVFLSREMVANALAHAVHAGEHSKDGWLVGYVTTRRLPIRAISCGLPVASLPSMCGRPGSEHWRRAGVALWAGICSFDEPAVTA